MDRTASLSLLRLQPYRLYFTARTTSALSEAMMPVALAIAVLAAGYGTGGLGLVMAAQVVMFVVFVMVGGVLADRFGPRPMMAGADLVRFAVQGVVTAALVTTRHPPFGMFLVCAVANGIATGLFQPGLGSMIPTIAPGRVQQAAGLVSSASALVQVVAAGAAGALIAVSGPQLVFGVDSVSYLVSGICMLRLKLPPRVRPQGPAHWRADMAEGWREFRARTWFWAVIAVFAFLGLAGFGPFGVLSASFLTTRHGATAFGVLLAAQGVGSVLGGLTTVRVRPRFPLRTGFLLAYVMAVPMVTLAFDLPLVLTGAAMLVSGWARAVQYILWTTTEQVHVPAPILNRLYAYDVSGCLSLLALGQAVAGPEADLLGVRASMLTSAAAMVVGCTVILAVPAVRRLPATPAPPEDAPDSDNQFTSAAPIDLKRWRRTRPLRDHGAA
jgi:MFS family permease